MRELTGAQGMAFAVHHAWKLDRCRCLVPRKKDWFRVLLTVSGFYQTMNLSGARRAYLRRRSETSSSRTAADAVVDAVHDNHQHVRMGHRLDM